MTAVATKHGFKDLQEWSDVAQSVVMSYAYLREGKGLAGARQDGRPAWSPRQSRTASSPTSKSRRPSRKVRELGAKLAKFQPLPQNYELVEKMIGKVAPVMKIQ